MFEGFAASTLVNRPLVVAFAEIVAACSDPDNDPVSVVWWEGTTSAGGEVTMGAESLSYTPVIDYEGPDDFQLTVQDGRGGFASAIRRERPSRRSAPGTGTG